MKNEYVAKQVKIIYELEALGIHIENIKEDYDTGLLKIYYSVPEASTLEISDKKLNEKIKTSDGLKLLAKDALMKIGIDDCENEFSDDDFIEEVQDNISDFIRFYAKIRVGEIWNEDKRKNRTEEIKASFDKVQDILSGRSYCEV